MDGPKQIQERWWGQRWSQTRALLRKYQEGLFMERDSKCDRTPEGDVLEGSLLGKVRGKRKSNELCEQRQTWKTAFQHFWKWSSRWVWKEGRRVRSQMTMSVKDHGTLGNRKPLADCKEEGLFKISVKKWCGGLILEATRLREEEVLTLVLMNDYEGSAWENGRRGIMKGVSNV